MIDLLKPGLVSQVDDRLVKYSDLPSFKRREFILPGLDPNVRYAGEDELKLKDAARDISHIRATCDNACG